jgi:hypothetical protein
MKWRLLDHVVRGFTSFVSNSRWDSVCFVDEVNVSLVLCFFVKIMGDKLLPKHIENLQKLLERLDIWGKNYWP